jgi:hypothetical protein
MKRLYAVILGVCLCFAINNSGEAKTRSKIKIPKECRTSNFTCVLKKNDGVPFFCVRTAKQRQQNARKKMRIVTRRNCIRRYPVEYIEESQDQQIGN